MRLCERGLGACEHRVAQQRHPSHAGVVVVAVAALSPSQQRAQLGRAHGARGRPAAMGRLAGRIRPGEERVLSGCEEVSRLGNRVLVGRVEETLDLDIDARAQRVVRAPSVAFEREGAEARLQRRGVGGRDGGGHRRRRSDQDALLVEFGVERGGGELEPAPAAPAPRRKAQLGAWFRLVPLRVAAGGAEHDKVGASLDVVAERADGVVQLPRVACVGGGARSHLAVRVRVRVAVVAAAHRLSVGARRAR
eukprot:5041179-Pleurochrysis_carterae.AAC.8